MIRPSRLTLLLPALLLAGCVNLAPDYQQPQAPIPQQWPASAELGSASAQIGWQAFFLDARIKQVIEQTLANNRDLRVAALNVEKARALYRVQRAEQLPTLNAGGSGTHRSEEHTSELQSQ